MKTLRSIFLITGIAALCSCSSSGQDKRDVSSNTSRNEVVETIMERRSIRKYKQKEVEKEILDLILKCGINAPNGMSKESWEVRVITNPQFIAEIDSLNRLFAVQSGYNSLKIKHVSHGAPVLIFIAHDKTYDLSQVDCGLFGANVVLSAQSIGLGTCCLGGIVRFMNSPKASSLLKKLDLPENYNLLYAIALGYPDESPKAKPRSIDKIKYID